MTGARHPRMASMSAPAIAERLAALDWQRLATDLDAHGRAVVHAVLSPQECVALATTTAPIRISMGSMSSRCRPPSCSRYRGRALRAANSCSRSGDHASNRALRWCRSAGETA
jgi:hypothetical protein